MRSFQKQKRLTLRSFVSDPLSDVVTRCSISLERLQKNPKDYLIKAFGDCLGDGGPKKTVVSVFWRNGALLY